jgi:hypothetical protein
MNSGLLVVLSLFLIYLAVTGKYKCVSAMARCVALDTAPCDCSQAVAPGQKGGAPARPGTIESAGRILEGIRGILGR